MMRRTVELQVVPTEGLGDREVEILMMTGGLKDDGYDLVPEGCQIDAYARNPIQLWQHSPEFPVGVNDNIRVGPDGVRSHCTFAPAGISAKADEVCGLVKAGIVRACSVGFHVIDREPIDPKKPGSGWRALRWELFECSFVSVPLDPQAGVTAREKSREGSMADWKCGAARDLPIQSGDPAWDGSAAEAAIFEWAGGDDFDPAKARRGFLAYDAESPKLRGSYKLPFVHVVNGELEVPKSALRAASGAHGVGAADIGGAKEEAQSALDHYKDKSGVGDDDGRSRRRHRASPPYRRRGDRTLPKIRGMWGVSQLAYIVDCLADCKYSAEIERQLEGDDSKVPDMLAANLRDLGETLVAMTTEEVAELLGDDQGDVDVILIDDGERSQVEKAKTPALKRFLLGRFQARAAMTSARAGAALSSANAAKLDEAEGYHSRAMDHHKAATEGHALVGAHHDGIADGVQRCRDAYDGMMEGLDGDDYDADEMRKRCRAMGRGLAAVGENLIGAQEEHEAVGDAHRGIGRSVRAASRCIRGMDGYEAGENSEGKAEPVEGVSSDEGSRSLDFRKRQAEKLTLLGEAA